MKNTYLNNRKIKFCLLLFLIISLIFSCIHPVYPDEIFLQHTATYLMIGFLIFVLVKNNLTNKSFFCFVLIVVIHIIGARWNYSNTPYDKWLNSVFGFSIDKFFDFKRNQYDRFVHFMYGFLLIIPISEIYTAWFKFQKKTSYHIAFLFVLASSLVYELIEWLVAIVLSPEQAEAYNGQQGDFWDAQKDMALAMFGAIIMILIRRIKIKKKNTL